MRQTSGTMETANIKKRRIVNSKQHHMKKQNKYEYIRGPSEDWGLKPMKHEIVEERTELLLQMKEGLREADALSKEIDAMWSLFTFEKNVLNLEMATVLRQSSGHIKETETQVLFAALGECLDNLKTETDLLKFPANKMVAEILKTVWYPMETEDFGVEMGNANDGERWVMGRTGPKPDLFRPGLTGQKAHNLYNSGKLGLHREYQSRDPQGETFQNDEKYPGSQGIYRTKNHDFGVERSHKDEWECQGPVASGQRRQTHHKNSQQSKTNHPHPLELGMDPYCSEHAVRDSAPQSSKMNFNLNNALNFNKMPFASVAYKAVDVFLKAAELKEILSQKLMIEKICENKRLCADELEWGLKEKSLVKKLGKSVDKKKDLEGSLKRKDQQIDFLKGILSKVLDKNGVVANGVNTLFKMFQSTNDFRRTLQNFNSQGSPSYNIQSNGLDPIFEVAHLRDGATSPDTDGRILSRRTHGKSEKSGFCFKDTLGTPLKQFQNKEERIFSPEKNNKVRETNMLHFALQTPETATFAEKSDGNSPGNSMQRSGFLLEKQQKKLFRKSNEQERRVKIKSRVYSEKKGACKDEFGSDLKIDSTTSFDLNGFVQRVEAKQFFNKKTVQKTEKLAEKEKETNQETSKKNQMNSKTEKKVDSQLNQSKLLESKPTSSNSSSLERSISQIFQSLQRERGEEKIPSLIKGNHKSGYLNTSQSQSHGKWDMDRRDVAKGNSFNKKVEKSGNNLSNFLLKNLASVTNSVYSESQPGESLQNNTILEMNRILNQVRGAEYQKRGAMRKGSLLTKTSQATKENSLSVVKDVFQEDFSMILDEKTSFNNQKAPLSLMTSVTRQLMGKNRPRQPDSRFGSGADVIPLRHESRNAGLSYEMQSFSEQMLMSFLKESVNKKRTQKPNPPIGVKLSENSERINCILKAGCKDMEPMQGQESNAPKRGFRKQSMDKPRANEYKMKVTSRELKRQLNTLKDMRASSLKPENISMYRRTLISLQEQLEKSDGTGGVAKSGVKEELQLGTGGGGLADMEKRDGGTISTQTGNQNDSKLDFDKVKRQEAQQPDQNENPSKSIMNPTINFDEMKSPDRLPLFKKFDNSGSKLEPFKRNPQTANSNQDNSKENQQTQNTPTPHLPNKTYSEKKPKIRTSTNKNHEKSNSSQKTSSKKKSERTMDQNTDSKHVASDKKRSGYSSAKRPRQKRAKSNKTTSKKSHVRSSHSNYRTQNRKNKSHFSRSPTDLKRTLNRALAKPDPLAVAGGGRLLQGLRKEKSNQGKGVYGTTSRNKQNNNFRRIAGLMKKKPYIPSRLNMNKFKNLFSTRTLNNYSKRVRSPPMRK